MTRNMLRLLCEALSEKLCSNIFLLLYYQTSMFLVCVCIVLMQNYILDQLTLDGKTLSPFVLATYDIYLLIYLLICLCICLFIGFHHSIWMLP